MYIYYDPKETNRIKAVYSGKPSTKAWDKAGYILAEIPKELKPTKLDTVVLDGDAVTGLNKDVFEPEVVEVVEHPLKGIKFSDLKREDKDLLLLDLLGSSGMIDEEKKIK